MIEADIGDYVLYSSGKRGDTLMLRKVVQRDKKGRIYFVQHKDYRMAFDPRTGKSGPKLGRILRVATKAEIRKHLRAERNQRKHDLRYRQQKYLDMLFIVLTIEENPDKFLSRFSKREIHRLAQRLRR